MSSPQKEQSPIIKKEEELKKRISEHLEQHKNNRIQLPALNFDPKKQLAQILKEANTVISNIRTTTKTNQVMHSMAQVITEYFECRNQLPRKTKLHHKNGR